MANGLEDQFMEQKPQGPVGGAFQSLVNTRLNVPRPTLGEDFGAIPGSGMPGGMAAPSPAQTNQSLLSMMAPPLAPGHTPWAAPRPSFTADNPPLSNISPDMGTFISPTTVKDRVKQAHSDFESQFAQPYYGGLEEGAIRGKPTLMGPGAEGKQRGGLALPDTKWFDEHAVDGGIWIDKEGKQHAMFYPRTAPGEAKSVTDQMQPLIDKFVGQITGQSGAISPNQMNAATAFMTASQTGGHQAAVTPSEIALNQARAASSGIVPNVSSGPNQYSSFKINPATGQPEPFATGTHQETHNIAQYITPVMTKFQEEAGKIMTDITMTDEQKSKSIETLKGTAKHSISVLEEAFGANRPASPGPGATGVQRMKLSELSRSFEAANGRKPTKAEIEDIRGRHSRTHLIVED